VCDASIFCSKVFLKIHYRFVTSQHITRSLTSHELYQTVWSALNVIRFCGVRLSICVVLFSLKVWTLNQNRQLQLSRARLFRSACTAACPTSVAYCGSDLRTTSGSTWKNRTLTTGAFDSSYKLYDLQTHPAKTSVDSVLKCDITVSPLELTYTFNFMDFNKVS